MSPSVTSSFREGLVFRAGISYCEEGSLSHAAWSDKREQRFPSRLIPAKARMGSGHSRGQLSSKASLGSHLQLRQKVERPKEALPALGGLAAASESLGGGENPLRGS